MSDATDEVKTRRGPPSRSETVNTRARILDSAEKLFAQLGFDGVSVRTIAADAGVQFALVGYHFGSKEELLDTVIGRRADTLGAARLEVLAKAVDAARGRPVDIGVIVRGFIGCIVERATSGEPGWAHYSELVAMLANAPRWRSLIAKHFNEVAAAYMVELQRSCPKVPAEVMHQAFFFSIGTMVAVCARPERIESMSEARYKSDDVSKLYDSLCVFLEGGIRALDAGYSSRRRSA